MVEIHWLITPGYFSAPLDFQRMCERLVLTSLGGKDVSVLSPEDLLLTLCMHGSKHCWERLGWIRDVAKLISLHREMRWQYAISEASKLRSERMLFLGLLLANDLLKVYLPNEVLKKVQADRVVRTLAIQVRDRLFRNDSNRSVIFQPFLFQLRMQAGLMDRIRYCVGYGSVLMTPTVLERRLIALPDSFLPLYYIVRPIRLMVKHGLRLARRPGR